MWVGKRLLTVITVAHICVRVITSLLVSLSVSMSCSVSCTKETVLGLQQVELPSHLQNSEH